MISLLMYYDLNNNLVQAFSCKYDAIRTLKISDKTLAKCLDKDILVQGNKVYSPNTCIFVTNDINVLLE